MGTNPKRTQVWKCHLTRSFSKLIFSLILRRYCLNLAFQWCFQTSGKVILPVMRGLQTGYILSENYEHWVLYFPMNIFLNILDYCISLLRIRSFMLWTMQYISASIIYRAIWVWPMKSKYLALKSKYLILNLARASGRLFQLFKTI